MALQPHDDKRGVCGTLGWWVTLEEAQERASSFTRERKVNKEKWWTIPASDGRVVPVRQYDTQKGVGGPLDKPVWLYAQGDMYLGEWKDFKSQIVAKGGGPYYPMEHGFGIYFNGAPDSIRGLVYVGEWAKGHCCSPNGKATWLRSSRTWRDNHWPGSSILKQGRRRLPCDYVGPFDENGLWGGKEQARVTLRDGTQGLGLWRRGFPVGDFWSEHVIRHPAKRESTYEATYEVQRKPVPISPDDSAKRASRTTHLFRIDKLRGKRKATEEDDERKLPANSRAHQPAVDDVIEIESSDGEEAFVLPRKGLGETNRTTLDDERKLPADSRAHQPTVVGVIGIQSSDDEDAFILPNNPNDIAPLPCLPVVGAASLRPATVRSTGSDQHLEDITDTIENIAAWLVSTIGYDFNDLELARSYARNFIAIGADSVRMIVGECLESDVFECVNKPIHQRRINKALALVNNPK